MLVVFTRVENPIAARLTVPPREGDTAKPNTGAGGVSESAARPPECPSTHRVTGERSYSASSPVTLAARAEICTPKPILSGTVIATGLVFPCAADRQLLSAIANQLVASGSTAQ